MTQQLSTVPVRPLLDRKARDAMASYIAGRDHVSFERAEQIAGQLGAADLTMLELEMGFLPFNRGLGVRSDYDPATDYES